MSRSKRIVPIVAAAVVIAASVVITTKQKGTLAVPYEVEIIWMQTNDTTRIRIDRENLHQYFPKNEWREYNRRNSRL